MSRTILDADPAIIIIEADPGEETVITFLQPGSDGGASQEVNIWGAGKTALLLLAAILVERGEAQLPPREEADDTE